MFVQSRESDSFPDTLCASVSRDLTVLESVDTKCIRKMKYIIGHRLIDMFFFTLLENSERRIGIQIMVIMKSRVRSPMKSI